MNLDYYGSGCRCLLRLRENLGNPIISDRSFITSHLGAFPEWEQRPGTAGLERLLDLAVELGISSGGSVMTDYDQILSEHQAGSAILIRIDEIRQDGRAEENSIQYSLLLDMDQNQMTWWTPTRDGLADTVIKTRSGFWVQQSATAVIFSPLEVIPAAARSS